MSTSSLSIKNKILYDLDIDNFTGIEIGPLMNPLVKKSEGNVEYIDRATTDEIKKWYSRNKSVDLDKIVNVDHVWGDQSLAEATGKKNYYNYCVAAHVIEHVPDLIGWLKEIEEVLCDNGIASFSVPDKRYTFDYLRPETVPADLIDAYLRKLKKPSIRHIYDHFSSFTEIDIRDAWSKNFDTSSLKPIKDPKRIFDICADAQQHDKYIDSHCWVFTSESFLKLLDSLNAIGLFNFRIKRFFGVEKHNFEFVVQLEKIPSSYSGEEKREAFLQSLVRTKNHLFKASFIAFPAGEAQVYFDYGSGFSELDSCTEEFSLCVKKQILEFHLPPLQLHSIRFDPIRSHGLFKIYSLELILFGEEHHIIPLSEMSFGEHIKSVKNQRNGICGRTYRNAHDPHMIYKLPDTLKNRS